MVEPSADTFLPTIRLVQASVSATAAAIQTTARVNLLIFIIDNFYYLNIKYLPHKAILTCSDVAATISDTHHQHVTTAFLHPTRVKLAHQLSLHRIRFAEESIFSVDGTTIGGDACLCVLCLKTIRPVRPQPACPTGVSMGGTVSIATV